jgi:hypothetical protein
MRMHGPMTGRLRLGSVGLVVLVASLGAGGASAGSWQPMGIGDCPGHDITTSRAVTPESGKCDTSFAGMTAVCWSTGCTYKNVPTNQCKGGASPGQMYTCSAYAQPSQTGRITWQARGIGDCPGRDVARTAGPAPDSSKCNASFAGFTAICWSNACTYKNVQTGQCIGGANPGQMYTCATYESSTPPTPPPPPNPRPQPVNTFGGWQLVGTGDCPGRDTAGSSGTTPDPSKCNTGTAGQTAVCWPQGCTYKSVETAACTGGANPGQMYTCTAAGATSSTGPSPAHGQPKLSGKRYSIINYNGDNQTPHDFIVDWKACKVAEVNQDYEGGSEDITVSVCRPNSRLAIKTVFRRTGYWIQYDWVLLDNGATLAGSFRDANGWGPSAGKRGK